jgi:hypothetical protein
MKQFFGTCILIAIMVFVATIFAGYLFIQEAKEGGIVSQFYPEVTQEELDGSAAVVDDHEVIVYDGLILFLDEVTPFVSAQTLSSDPNGANMYKMTLEDDSVRYLLWGSGEVIAPEDATERMSTVAPDGEFIWTPLEADEVIALTKDLILLK